MDVSSCDQIIGSTMTQIVILTAFSLFVSYPVDTDFTNHVIMKLENIIPITIVTGFLGAGKTSLINHLLKTATNQVQMVVVNDFGAEKLAIDLVSPQGVVKLIHGCICCSSRGALQKVIAQNVSAESAPAQILIETSGVANPSAIVTALRSPELKKRVAVQAVITIVAADQILTFTGEMSEMAKVQLAAANLFVVNKIDLVSEGQLNRVLGWLQAFAMNKPIILAEQGRVHRMDAQKIETFHKEPSSGIE